MALSGTFIYSFYKDPKFGIVVDKTIIPIVSKTKFMFSISKQNMNTDTNEIELHVDWHILSSSIDKLDDEEGLNFTKIDTVSGNFYANKNIKILQFDNIPTAKSNKFYGNLTNVNILAKDKPAIRYVAPTGIVLDPSFIYAAFLTPEPVIINKKQNKIKQNKIKQNRLKQNRLKQNKFNK